MLPELETLATNLDANRRRLDALLGELDADAVERAPREGQYSARQVLAHLAGAERGMTRLLQLMVRGEQPRLKSDYDNDYYNARQQEKRAHLSVAELRAELRDTERDLLRLMEALRPEDLDKGGQHPIIGDATVLQVLQQLENHEREHIGELEAWARASQRA